MRAACLLPARCAHWRTLPACAVTHAYAVPLPLIYRVVSYCCAHTAFACRLPRLFPVPPRERLNALPANLRVFGSFCASFMGFADDGFLVRFWFVHFLPHVCSTSVLFFHHHLPHTPHYYLDTTTTTVPSILSCRDYRF